MKLAVQFNIILALTLTLALQSCEASFGDKYTVDNFEIYYGDNVNDKYITGTAQYFKENGLIQDQKHSAQLLYDEGQATFRLNLILNKKYDKLPPEMIRHFLWLEEDMRTVIFDDLNFELVVCNEHFEPIE